MKLLTAPFNKRIKIIRFMFVFLIVSFSTQAKHLHKEIHYQTLHCNAINGKIEYRLPNRLRVDCLTEKYAIEHDFASNGKYFECVGQALAYGMLTSRQSVCALIIETEKDIKRVKIVEALIKYHNLNLLLVKIYPNGNEIICKSEVADLCNN